MRILFTRENGKNVLKLVKSDRTNYVEKKLHFQNFDFQSDASTALIISQKFYFCSDIFYRLRKNISSTEPPENRDYEVIFGSGEPENVVMISSIKKKTP